MPVVFTVDVFTADGAWDLPVSRAVTVQASLSAFGVGTRDIVGTAITCPSAVTAGDTPATGAFVQAFVAEVLVADLANLVGRRVRRVLAAAAFAMHVPHRTRHRPLPTWAMSRGVGMAVVAIGRFIGFHFGSPFRPPMRTLPDMRPETGRAKVILPSRPRSRRAMHPGRMRDSVRPCPP